MEIKVVEQTKSKLKVELVGKTHTLANALTKELWNDKNVTVAGYNLPHPQVTNVALIVETSKGDPKKALSGAISRLKKDNKALNLSLKKIK